MHAANLCWLPRGGADLAGEGQMASSVAVRISSILIGRLISAYQPLD